MGGGRVWGTWGVDEGMEWHGMEWDGMGWNEKWERENGVGGGDVCVTHPHSLLVPCIGCSHWWRVCGPHHELP